MAVVQRLALAVLWILVAALIALGSAGLVAMLDHQPGTPARAELTWAADSAVDPELDRATEDLAAIGGDLETLAGHARTALQAVGGRDFEPLTGAIDAGAVLVLEIGSDAGALRERLEGMSAFGQGAEMQISPMNRARHAELLRALDGTGSLVVEWERLTESSLAAARVSGLLTTHDQTVASAIERGRGGDFEGAIDGIDEAVGLLDQTEALGNRMAAQVDVATLDEWIRRNRTYDEALRALYVASAESPDRVTPAIRAALTAEQQARAELPRNTNGLAIIMSDIGRGGLSQAVVAIEEARGRVAAALERLQTPAPSPAAVGRYTRPNV